MRPREPRREEPGSSRPRAVDSLHEKGAGSHKFDPETEITLDDLQDMKAHIRTGVHAASDARMAMSIAIMAPDTKTELHIDDTKWVEIQHTLDWYRGRLNWRGFAHQAAAMVMFAPELKAKFNIDTVAWDGMLAALDAFRQKQEPWNVHPLASDMALIFPNRRAELKLDEGDLQYMKDRLKKAWERSDWALYNNIVTDATVLFPDRRAELNIDATAWDGMRATLDSRRGPDISGFSHMACNLTILAADEIRITEEGGLELINHPKPVGVEPLPPRAVA